METQKVVIVGAGCAGLSAGIYCARADLEPLIFSGTLQDKGGLLVKTSIVENYPGFPEGILGYDLVSNMEEQAKKFGARITDRNINRIQKDGEIFKIIDDKGDEYFTRSIIIATGSKPNKLGLKDEDRLWGKGLSSCCVCDAVLYRRKIAAVVGGGDSAAESALFLTKFTNVTLFLRRDVFRASKIMEKRVLDNPKIKVVYNTEVIKIEGENNLEFITVKNNITGVEEKMKMNGLFYSLGLTPNTYVFKDLVETHNGYIKQFNGTTSTSVKGIFSAGDVSDEKYRQAVMACGDGCKAALDVIDFLQE